MTAPQTLQIPLSKRLVSESEALRLIEAQERVKQEYEPKRGGWVGEEHLKKEAA